MSDDVSQQPSGPDPRAPIPFAAPRRGRRRRGGKDSKPRLRKLRFLSILIGLGALAVVSTIFGMMMAVASDLPQLENRAQYKKEANSYLYDDHWHLIGLFAPPDNVVIDEPSDIAAAMQHAIISVEDKRFESNPGVDLRGIARAVVSDVTGGNRQGGSTIAEQFVKNALAEQSNRTVFEKLREAALAYHLAHRWTKQKILTEYLNSIYFGNGAYGIESAARVYFGKVHHFYADASSASGTSTAPGCGDGSASGGAPVPKCASLLTPWEAALLAGMVADPNAYDPLAHPHAAWARRRLVLHDMYEQHYISASEYARDINRPLPTHVDVQQPSEPTAAPYFTSWLRPQVLAAMGLGHGVPGALAEYRAYYGGLQIRTTLDLKLQQAAEQTIAADLPYAKGGPAASLVAIDNKTGEVRAMVGGPIVDGHEDFDQYPFNLATQGHRQPGSAFKPFTLAVALESGVTPDTLFTSAPISFVVPHSRGKEHFVVRNFGGNYSGLISLANATAISDNSVYARLGIQRLGSQGTTRVAAMAHAMGIRSPLSTNYAMILGGLREGVTPLDMAHAYETFATGGKRVYSTTLGTPDQGPTGIAQIRCYVVSCHGRHSIEDHPRYDRVLPGPVAKTVHDVLAGVVNYGTATKAGITGVDVVGKTGTTSNYGDAWFVGWTPQMTVAVWVGVPDRLVPMSTLYNGQPVEGGTYPAIIWHDFVTQALQILAAENPKQSGQPTTAASTLGTGSSASSAAAGTVTSVTPTTSTTPAAGTTPSPTTPATGPGTPTTPAAGGAGGGTPTTPRGGGGTPTTPGAGGGGGTGGGTPTTGGTGLGGGGGGG
jgi:penicillin-binding protein 1A